ncbi:hypothetical protein Tco_1394928 [Tanacetum coccineum]
MSLVLKAQVATLDEGTGSEKRCGYFFQKDIDEKNFIDTGLNPLMTVNLPADYLFLNLQGRGDGFHTYDGITNTKFYGIVSMLNRVLVTPGSVVVTPVTPGSVITTGSILVTPGSVITTGSILVTPGQARNETKHVKDYILLPLWTADPPYSQDPNSSHDDGSKPLSDDGKKVDKDSRKESEWKDQEKEDNVNSTNTVNVAGTNEDNVVNGKTSVKLV